MRIASASSLVASTLSLLICFRFSVCDVAFVVAPAAGNRRGFVQGYINSAFPPRKQVYACMPELFCRGKAKCPTSSKIVVMSGDSAPSVKVLWPMGLFSPFVSKSVLSPNFMAAVDHVTTMSCETQDKSAEFLVRSLEMSPAEAAQKADILEAERDDCKQQWMRLLNSDDFQVRQTLIFTEMILSSKSGFGIDQLLSVIEWRIKILRARANGSRAPKMPPEVKKILENQLNAMDGEDDISLDARVGIDVLPFAPDSTTIKSPVVAEEVKALLQDNDAIVMAGELYGRLSRDEKRKYIRDVEAIEERWMLFMRRLQLLGDVNPEYVLQTQEYMESFGMANPQEYVEAMAKCRDIMRKDLDEDSPR